MKTATIMLLLALLSACGGGEIEEVPTPPPATVPQGEAAK